MTPEDKLFAAEFAPTSTSPTVNGAPFSSPASGITVHYTADRDVPRLVTDLAQRGLGYHLIIDRDGAVFQMASLGVMLAHAGIATWRGQSPNHNHLAISLVSWGFLDDSGFSFSGARVPVEEAKRRPGNISQKIQLWDAATEAQEQKLLAVLRWFVAHGIGPANICGHDECARPMGRKSDPGGVLQWRMQELRSLVAVTSSASAP